MSDISLEQQQEWAAQLLSSLEDSSTQNSSTVAWLRSNLGLLNYTIGSNFSISGEFISPEMSQIESGIYNEMYICYWLKKKSRTLIGSMDYDWSEMQGEDQGKIKVVTKTQKSQVYSELAKECERNLKDLVKTYKGGDFVVPQQVLYNERLSVPIHMVDLSLYSWSDLNPINC